MGNIYKKDIFNLLLAKCSVLGLLHVFLDITGAHIWPTFLY